VVPNSGRPRRGPGVQRPGHQRSVRSTSGRRPGDRHRVGHLTSGRRWDDRRRTNHGRQAGRLVRGRHPGMRRRRHARQAAAAGRRLWAGRRNGARANPRPGHHRGGHPRAGHRCAGDRHGSHRYASCRPADHLHGGHRRAGRRCAGHRCAGDRHGSHRYASCRPADRPHVSRRCAGDRHGTRRYVSCRSEDRLHGGDRRAGHRYGGDRQGTRRYAGCRSEGHLHGGHLHGGHRRAGHRYGDDRHGSRPYAGRPVGDWPHEGHQYEGHRPGNCSPADCRWRRGHERGGRCSRRRSRVTLPGQPGRCRCGTNLACSPVSHPTGRSGPGGCRPSCFHPGCHNGHRLGPGRVRCLNLGAADWAHRCFRRHRTGPCLHHWLVPDRHSRRDPGQNRCWNGPDRGRHPPNGSGPAPRHRYGPGRPDPARLPRCCSTLS
jgi:hypothetical protein